MVKNNWSIITAGHDYDIITTNMIEFGGDYSPAQELFYTPIKYWYGSAVYPQPRDSNTQKIIVHVCNTWKIWKHTGYDKDLEERWPGIRERYIKNCKMELGYCQFIRVGKNIIVVNVVAEDGLKNAYNSMPLDYLFLEKGLLCLALIAYDMGASIHMPRLACDSAGGDWKLIAHLIDRVFRVRHIDVNVYDI